MWRSRVNDSAYWSRYNPREQRRWNIRVRVNAPCMFDQWAGAGLEYIDQEDSASSYAAMLADTVREAYPNANVSVRIVKTKMPVDRCEQVEVVPASKSVRLTELTVREAAAIISRVYDLADRVYFDVSGWIVEL